MGRVSVKENKNRYQLAREALALSREKGSELLGCVSADRIEKIENERCLPQPEEVLIMADKYRQPDLCNYYCSRQCPIGLGQVPEIHMKELSGIVLEMLASLNSVNKKRDRLIEIAADGKIDSDEIGDFVRIQEELEGIAAAVDTLQLWSKKMLADGIIDEQEYNARRSAR